jgi:hypothetical protein
MCQGHRCPGRGFEDRDITGWQRGDAAARQETETDRHAFAGIIAGLRRLRGRRRVGATIVRTTHHHSEGSVGHWLRCGHSHRPRHRCDDKHHCDHQADPGPDRAISQHHNMKVRIDQNELQSGVAPQVPALDERSRLDHLESNYGKNAAPHLGATIRSVQRLPLTPLMSTKYPQNLHLSRSALERGAPGFIIISISQIRRRGRTLCVSD